MLPGSLDARKCSFLVNSQIFIHSDDTQIDKSGKPAVGVQRRDTRNDNGCFNTSPASSVPGRTRM